MNLPSVIVALIGTALLCLAAKSQAAPPLPPLAPKAYRIGIAPSHITTTPDALFQEGAAWRAVRDKTDLYKYYALQLAPPPWATKLSPAPFVAFARKHKIAIGAEFGSFALGAAGGPVPDATEAALRELQPIYDAGGPVATLHLDDPAARMIRGLVKHPNALTLDEIAARLAEFWKKVHQAHPRIEIGLITNFPNWDYTKEFPGYNGHNTDLSGATYHEVVGRIHGALAKAGERIAFVEVDCPYNYYRQTRTRNGDAALDGRGQFLALQKWCQERKIKFHLILNCEVGSYPPGAKLTGDQQAAADKAFHDGTLEYIRRLRADGVFPDGFLIQSWYVAPREHLPESQQYTFMYTARQAIELIEKAYPRKKD